ncbi:MAG: hypothetical protein FWE02_05580, partial [Defluviitaleaceae bacterium]|nr:hypothetical protein [Defluviitaleaceae bacterium]
MNNFTQLVLFLVSLFLIFFIFFTEVENEHNVLEFKKSLFSFALIDAPAIYSDGRDIFFISSNNLYFYENLEQSWFYEHNLTLPLSFFSDGRLYFAEIGNNIFYIFDADGLVEKVVYDYPIITFGAGTVVLDVSYGYRVEREDIQFTVTEALPSIISKRNENEFAISFLNLEDELFSSVAFYNPELALAINFPRLVTSIDFIENFALITFSDTILMLDIETREIIWEKEKLLTAHTNYAIAIYNDGRLQIVDIEGTEKAHFYGNISYLAADDYFLIGEGNVFTAITEDAEILFQHTILAEVISVHFIEDGL